MAKISQITDSLFNLLVSEREALFLTNILNVMSNIRSITSRGKRKSFFDAPRLRILSALNKFYENKNENAELEVALHNEELSYVLTALETLTPHISDSIGSHHIASFRQAEIDSLISVIRYGHKCVSIA